MKKKRIIKILAMLLIATRISTAVGVVAGDTEDGYERDKYGVIQVTEDNTYEKTKFYKDSIFGIAGGFHLVGFESVKTAAHTNGNILTNNLIYKDNFGTNPKGTQLTEISYVRNISDSPIIDATPYKESVLVVGKDVDVGDEDNGNAWSINGNKMDAPRKQDSPNSLWQDTEVEFIDLVKVESQVKALSEALFLKKENQNISKVSNDQNNQSIEVSSTNSGEYSVYNIKEGDFIFTNPISIQGFDPNKTSTLIINVDMDKFNNKETFSIPNSVAYYTNNTSVSTGEVTTWSNANVIWNIYDSNAEDKIFTGTIKNNDAVTASILAPGADVILGSNLNGTVIAKNITVSAESHRDDYSGDLKLTDFIDEDPENPGDTDPEGTDPEGTDPEGTDPEGINPEGTDPEGTDPEGTDPEGTDPEGTDPEGTDPEGTDPEGTDPEGTDPEGTDPEGTDPEGTDPEGTDPEGTDPEGTDPEGTDPEGTDPEGTDPEGTDPEGTDPEGTDPEGTDPEGTDPEGTDPGETDPGETDPEETDPGETDPGETDPEEIDSTGEDPTDEDSIGEDPTEEDDVTSNDKTSGVTDLKLGDNSSIILWIALMIVSLTGLITILFKKKKKTLG